MNAVNDPPGFQAPAGATTLSALLEVLAGHSEPQWVTAIDPGPPDESGQTVEFQVSTDNPAAFSTIPQVDPSGNLFYRAELTGSPISVNATIVAEDSDGATSAPQGFTITINP